MEGLDVRESGRGSIHLVNKRTATRVICESRLTGDGGVVYKIRQKNGADECFQS